MESTGPQPSFGIAATELPRFADQVNDESRGDLIRSAAGTVYGIGSDTSIADNILQENAITEQEALMHTRLLLENAITHPELPGDIAAQAEDIYNNLSFIGSKELAEATNSIADYWKTYLDNNPKSAIFVVTSESFTSEESEIEADDAEEIDFGYVSNQKSDNYIMDMVMDHFSDEELQEYSGRLLFSAADLAGHPEAIKTIILDDWMMSGQQMREKLDETFHYLNPADLEIHLVVCNAQRLADGVAHSQAASPIPVKSYFVSHGTNHPYASEFGGAYLTAAHSSGDYPFEGAVENIVEALNTVRNPNDEQVYMPPLANIIRPYYSPDYSPRYIERLNSLRAIGRTMLAEKL